MQSSLTTGVWRRVAWLAAAIVIVVLALWFAARIPKTISIFLIAAFIAFGVQPIVGRLERRMPKWVAVAIVFLGLFVLVAVFLVVVVPLTISQTQLLAANLPSYAGGVQSWLSGMESSLETHFPMLKLPPVSFTRIGGAQMAAWVTGAIASLGAIALNTFTAFFIAFSAIILSVFFLLNDTQVAEGFTALFPPNKRQTARKLAAEVTDVFGSYISGQVIVSAITGAVVAVATTLLGFKFSLIVGIISAIGYAIPIIGMLIAEIVAIPLSAPQGLWMIVWVQVVMFGMARISDNVLVPKIMGQSVGVSPIGAMFAVFAGGELFGIPGLILGIPIAALIKILWRYFVAPWLSAQFEKG
ncbi:MAG: AI-2E family transporter [Candidatus Eremiobacteraeota bacterium]|nr:AI-2E family transporter [Candidatus Eremiobacteraeota bacterium]